SMGLLGLQRSLRLAPDVVAGHSYGELVALHAEGVFGADALAEISSARGRFLRAAAGEEPGAMLAIHAATAATEALIEGAGGVVVANCNGPAQTVISGPREAIERVLETAIARGLYARTLPAACAFHSPLVSGARAPLAELAGRLAMAAPAI